MTLGERIRAVRQEKRMSTLDLAVDSGICVSHIRVLESDKADPILLSVATIAKVLGVSVDYLVTGKVAPLGNRNESPCLHFQRRIAEARRAKKYTISQLARATGFGYHVQWNWECKGNYPKLSHIAKVAEVLDVSLEWLAFGERSEEDV